ncbi:hypothetical protein [Streptomyces sp. NPDC088812]|uniref:hypothetical protein n=1 Tax=Streptomyces sp. NPDC088812 TaxID=3365905 RepID=UPI003813DFD4
MCATAAADQSVRPDAAPAGRPLPAHARGAAPAGRPLPAHARGAATPRVPGTPLTTVRAAAARLGGLAPLSRIEVAHGYLALALSALGRLPRPGAARRITVSLVPVRPVGEPFSPR